MKNLLILILFFLPIFATSQTMPKDSISLAKTGELQKERHKTKTATYHLFKGAKGGLFYIRKSKSGNWYKVYLPKTSAK